jgi:perosamine synthetase
MIPLSKPIIGEAEKRAVLEVLDSGLLVQGERVAALESKFAQLCGVKHAIAVSSGTAALHLALLANDIGAGDEVITTPFTFGATVNSILLSGARPVFVDVEADTFNMNPNLIERAITPRTKAIMPVYLYGLMCAMDALQSIADRHGLQIIEDACQAIGATYHDRAAGSFGTGAFSLYATKNVMSGEGGMITTNADAVADRCRLLRNHGMRQRFQHEFASFNYRLSDLHAAIGLAQIDRVHEFNAQRRSNADYFNAKIESVITPRSKEGYGHVWHQYTVRVEGDRDRAAAVKQLNDRGVGTGVYYPVPLHRQGYVREKIGDVSLPVAEQLAREVISLPVHPSLTPSELEVIVAEVNQL